MLAAIIVAAGNSRRMGFDKVFATLAGKPVIAHAVEAFARTKSVAQIVVVARHDKLIEIRQAAGQEQKLSLVIAGGEHRQDSVRLGLASIEAEARYVAIHDAARPLITPEQIERVFAAACAHGAAALAAPVTDTLKRADDDRFVSGGVDRERLFAMQTPQIFERGLIEKAYRAIANEKLSITDDVSAVEHIGGKVLLVPHDEHNFKITYPADLALAELVINSRS